MTGAVLVLHSSGGNGTQQAFGICGASRYCSIHLEDRRPRLRLADINLLGLGKKPLHIFKGCLATYAAAMASDRFATGETPGYPECL